MSTNSQITICTVTKLYNLEDARSEHWTYLFMILTTCWLEWIFRRYSINVINKYV